MTCQTCGCTMPPDRRKDAKFCSKPCINASQPPCRVDECEKPRRAKGLCSTHYNRQTPATIIIAKCSVCGCEVVKHKQQVARGHVVCSYACRTYLQFGTWPSSAVPATHPSRATFCRVLRSHPSRDPMRIRGCDWCATEFITRRWADRYCSRRCHSKAAAVRRRGRESDGHVYSWTQVMRVFALLDHRCAYCGEQPDGPPDPDHVVPLSRNGSNGNGNILPSCRPCNSDKRDLLLHEWAEDRARRGKPPVRTTIDRTHPAFAHLLPDAVGSGSLPALSDAA